ncbi:nucleoside triphosphate pyrophosphohydrolase [Actinophytocola xinjiangensis]|uniref:Nucleoside triphosphate pyrophosphohydrolase n=1 Tax=Actinophytocola xinjiangensis TaxID=485602 RepID=A0A7Z0WNU0_9PSEU|nr:MazG family protein [Actinophytocola xinjiangensis]OLF11069.1 nucleoside triphosphate pyrophosphohydrolase [Actinophytocola xinjiangensis]
MTVGTAVVLVDPARPDVLPLAALPLVRAAGAVFATPGLGVDLPAPPAPETLAGLADVVLVAGDADDPGAVALVSAGARVVRAAGSGLLDAVAVMDRLRSPGGCPWDAEQTHDSLRRYLREESYELLDALEDGDRAAMREELGDVLLQVLFHARVAAEDPDDPFDVDDVAAGLVGKLVGRHPHVFAGGDPAVRDAASQVHRWEELKQAEKRRESSVDGVALAQPALALAAKLVARTRRVNLPPDLLPTGSRLFRLAAESELDGGDPEGELRTVARRFDRDVRAAERAARDAGVDPGSMDEHAWRRFWPRGVGQGD